MLNSYGFHYAEDDSSFLFKLFSIGHETVSSEAYRWNGLKRGGKGMVFQYSLQGGGRLRVGKEIYSVPKGHAFIVSIPSDHEYYFDSTLADSWEVVWIRFEPIGEDWLSKELMRLGGPVVELGADALPLQLLWTLHRDSAAKQLGDRYDLSLRIYEFLVAFQRSLHSRGPYKGSELPQTYREVAAYIHTNYHRDLTLDQLAEVAGVSKYHLCNRFPHFFGVTPMDYVRNRRLEQAAELLRTSDLPITGIAARCGFSNVSYFGKVFHKIIGMSPSTYREAREGQVQSRLRLLE